MSRALARLADDLARGLGSREAEGLLRRRSPRAGMDLCSNDVLGYGTDPVIAERVAQAVRAWGTGAGAARLLRGNLPLHEACEQRLAAFSGREAALLSPSGYLANLGLLGALVGSGDRVLSDHDNHASLIDGLRLARARVDVLDLDDLEAVERRLAAHAPGGRTWIVVESVVSTTGRLPRLDALADAAERHGAWLLVDEAHATGLHGARGSGRVEALGLTPRVAATVHTGGKALGVAGAWVAGDRVLIEHLVNAARTFLFSTAPMPALAAGLVAALERLAGDAEGPATVLARAADLRARLRAGGLAVGGDGTHIVHVPVGDAAAAQALAERVQRDGFDVRALRPPTVRPGASCLRLTLRRDLAPADLGRLAERLLHHALAGAGSAP